MIWYECADCGWEWPYGSPPDRYAECEGCGGYDFQVWPGGQYVR